MRYKGLCFLVWETADITIAPSPHLHKKGCRVSLAPTLLWHYLTLPPSATSHYPSQTTNVTTLFCLLKGESFQKSFPISFSKDKAISHLRTSIKDACKPYLDHVSASYLTLYNILIPWGDYSALEEAYRQIQQPQGIPELDVFGLVGEVIHGLATGCTVHILVIAPGKSLSGSSALPPLYRSSLHFDTYALIDVNL